MINEIKPKESNDPGGPHKLWQWSVNGLGGLFALAGVGIVVAQLIWYLWDGTWVEVPMGYLVVLAPDVFVSWLDHPESWRGLSNIIRKFLSAVPLSAFLVVVGWALLSYRAKKTPVPQD